MDGVEKWNLNLGACVSKFALKTLSLGEGVIRYTSKNAE